MKSGNCKVRLVEKTNEYFSKDLTISVVVTFNNIWVKYRGGSRGAISPLKPAKVTFFKHNFVQFGKQHSRCRAILSFIVLSQKYCEVCLISLSVAKPWWEMTTKYYCNRPLPNRTGWMRPWLSMQFASAAVSWVFYIEVIWSRLSCACGTFCKIMHRFLCRLKCISGHWFHCRPIAKRVVLFHFHRSVMV